MARKEDFRSLLYHKHDIDLAHKLAKLLKREEKFYNKVYQAAKKLTIKFFDNPNAQVVIEGEKEPKALKVVLPMIQMEHDKAFKRYMDTLRTAFPYCHPTMKAVEVKGDTAGRIAFSVTIPEIKPEKKKNSKTK